MRRAIVDTALMLMDTDISHAFRDVPLAERDYLA